MTDVIELPGPDRGEPDREYLFQLIEIQLNLAQLLSAVAREALYAERDREPENSKKPLIHREKVRCDLCLRAKKREAK